MAYGNWRQDVVDIRDAGLQDWVVNGVYDEMARMMREIDGPEHYSIEDELGTVMQGNVEAIAIGSDLYDALVEWHGGHDAMMGAVRLAVEDNGHLYFFSGNGYNRLDMDLLGGQGDDRARAAFERYLETGDLVRPDYDEEVR